MQTPSENTAQAPCFYGWTLSRTVPGVCTGPTCQNIRGNPNYCPPSIFSPILVKTPKFYLGSWVSGRESAHKSRAAWAVFSLGVCMRERQHIYEDLNESSSASPGGSQQLKILPSPNNKRAANFFQIRWFFTRRGDFNARQDSSSAYISARRQYFVNLPIFL